MGSEWMPNANIIEYVRDNVVSQLKLVGNNPTSLCYG